MLYSNIIKRAIAEANKADYTYKVGAVVFKGKRIYGSGHNGIRTSAIPLKHKKWKESLHAEQAALLHLDWSKLKGASILVYRCDKQGKLAMSRPCDMCQKIIKYVGIKNMYYTTNNGEIVLEKVSSIKDNE